MDRFETGPHRLKAPEGKGINLTIATTRRRLPEFIERPPIAAGIEKGECQAQGQAMPCRAVLVGVHHLPSAARALSIKASREKKRAGATRGLTQGIFCTSCDLGSLNLKLDRRGRKTMNNGIATSIDSHLGTPWTFTVV